MIRTVGLHFIQIIASNVIRKWLFKKKTYFYSKMRKNNSKPVGEVYEWKGITRKTGYMKEKMK